jgi:transposase
MITDKQWEQVLAGIASGLNNDDACASAGVSRSLFYKRTKEEVDFLDRYKRAKIQFKLTHIRKIADNSSWQSSAWLLERKFAEEFVKKDYLDVTTLGEKINNIKVEIIKHTGHDSSGKKLQDKNKSSS